MKIKQTKKKNVNKKRKNIKTRRVIWIFGMREQHLENS